MEGVGSVGVAGAGVMGREVAQVLAQSGLGVVLVDVSAAALRSARAAIEQNLRFQRLLGARDGQVRRADVLARIAFATDYAGFAGVDFVIENVTEDWDVKRCVYGEIDALCPPHCVFAANTSVIPITRIGSATGRAARVIGTHFMNPVSLKPMVEVIRGHHTSDETVEATRALLTRMGKECIVVGDSPGFVTNRVLMLTVNEAMYLVHERVASAEEVDRLFKGCFGHKMGPLETADLIGLDTVLRSIELLHECFSDSKYRPCPLLRRMVDAGLHGRKSGQGFYRYDVGTPVDAAGSQG
jgi:3-hydroxybutyryl-CoA dehydrogenase